MNVLDVIIVVSQKFGNFLKFGRSVAHDKPIPHAKQNLEIPTNVIDNDVIMSKFECFHQKALNLKRLYHSS